MARDNFDLITNMIAFKLFATDVNGAMSMRADFIKASIWAGLDNPIFGLGYRNFYQVRYMYPDLQLPPIGRMDNPHNLFAQILVSGGFPAEALFLFVLVTPFAVMWRKLAAVIRSRPVRTVVIALSAGIWFTYAFVQLQLIAQPPFWLLCGIVFGLHPPGADRGSTNDDGADGAAGSAEP